MATIASSYDRRKEIEHLTQEQRNTLDKYYKSEKADRLLTDIFKQSDEWELVDFVVNEGYGDSSQKKAKKLYCECGKELKYQYVLHSRKKDQTIKLGIKHFKDHAGITQRIANQIFKKSMTLESWLDDILKSVKKWRNNPDGKTAYQSRINIFISLSNSENEFINQSNNHISKKDLALIHDFNNVELPLPMRTFNKVEQALKLHHQQQSAKNHRANMWASIKKGKEVREGYKPQKRTSKNTNKVMYEVNKEVTKAQRYAIAECRIAIDKYFRKHNELDFSTLYELTKEQMDILLADFTPSEAIKLIANSVISKSNNVIKVKSGKFEKVSEKLK